MNSHKHPRDPAALTPARNGQGGRAIKTAPNRRVRARAELSIGIVK